MPRDARLGFVVGVATVIVIAVVMYQGDGKASATNTAVKSRLSAGDQENTTPIGRPPSGPRTHIVQKGETLATISQHYYHDAGKADVLYRANVSELKARETLPIGSVLVVPELD